MCGAVQVQNGHTQPLLVCRKISEDEEQQLAGFLEYPFRKDLTWMQELLRQPPLLVGAKIKNRRKAFDERKALYYERHMLGMGQTFNRKKLVRP
jgi:hypothetical protein